jgi:hypothetical protein
MLITFLAPALLAAAAGIATIKAHAAVKSHTAVRSNTSLKSYTTAAFAALPRWWVNQALCIHRHESIDWHATRDWRGYPSVDHGGMQIAVGTWLSLAPRRFPREPAAASPHEQLLVAYRIWRLNGHRFGGSQWPYSSRACRVP